MRTPPKVYTWQEHILYSSVLLVVILIGVPLIIFLGAWALKGLFWYANLWMLLPWPPR